MLPSNWSHPSPSTQSAIGVDEPSRSARRPPPAHRSCAARRAGRSAPSARLGAGLEDRRDFVATSSILALPAIDGMAGAEDVDAGGEPLLDQRPADSARFLVVGEGGVDADDRRSCSARSGRVMPPAIAEPVRRDKIGGEQKRRHPLVRRPRSTSSTPHSRVRMPSRIWSRTAPRPAPPRPANAPSPGGARRGRSADRRDDEGEPAVDELDDDRIVDEIAEERLEHRRVGREPFVAHLRPASNRHSRRRARRHRRRTGIEAQEQRQRPDRRRSAFAPAGAGRRRGPGREGRARPRQVAPKMAERGRADGRRGGCG